MAFSLLHVQRGVEINNRFAQGWDVGLAVVRGNLAATLPWAVHPTQPESGSRHPGGERVPSKREGAGDALLQPFTATFLVIFKWKHSFWRPG